MKNDLDRISRKWQLGHLKYYFGLYRASASLGSNLKLFAKQEGESRIHRLESKRDGLGEADPVSLKLAKA